MNTCKCPALFTGVLLSASLLFACTSTPRFYHGRVADEKGRPLEGVKVKEMLGQQSVITNTDGYFQLAKDPARLDDLVFDKKGYHCDTVPTVFTHSGESIDYQFLGKDTTEVTLRPAITPTAQ